MGPHDQETFRRALHELETDPNILKLRQFSSHHGHTNTFQHCRNVAICSFRLSRKLRWRIDERALARGAMLHDYYLYCKKEKPVSAFRHGTTHPALALRNAERIFDLSEKEKNMILSHMWPLTFFSIPRSREAFLICIADKYCAVREFSGKTQVVLYRNFKSY